MADTETIIRNETQVSAQHEKISRVVYIHLEAGVDIGMVVHTIVLPDTIRVFYIDFKAYVYALNTGGGGDGVYDASGYNYKGLFRKTSGLLTNDQYDSMDLITTDAVAVGSNYNILLIPKAATSNTIEVTGNRGGSYATDWIFDYEITAIAIGP